MAKEVYGKGRAEITEGRPEVANIVAGMGWRMTENTPRDLYFDMIAFGVGEDGYCRNPSDIIYFANPEMRTRRDDIFKHMDVDEVIKHKTLKDEDFEQILVALYEVPRRIRKIVFCAGIYDAKKNGYTLNQIENLHFHIFNEENKEVLAVSRYNKYFTVESCLTFGRLYRLEDGGWKYEGENEGYIGDLGTLYAMYVRDEDEEVDPKGHNPNEEIEEGYGHSIDDLLTPKDYDEL